MNGAGTERRIVGGLVAALGAGLGGVELLNVVSIPGALNRVAEGLLPLLGAVTLVVAGYRLATGRLAAGGVRRVAGWTIIGMSAMSTLYLWLLAHQAIHAGTFRQPGFVLVNNLIVGALLGVAVGSYDARSHSFRREAEIERARALDQRAKLAFLNRELRHHVLNGVNVVLGNADALADHVDPAGSDHLAAIEARGREIVDRVESVRTIGRAFTSDLDDPVAETDAVATVEEAVETARRRYESAEFRLDTPASATVRADGLLDEVIENLLSNAVEHSDRETPHVAVTVETAERTVAIRVADDGPGLPDDVEAALDDWDPRSPTSGIGVGLATVRALVDRYGGEVGVGDRTEGATVVVSLPRALD